MENDFEKLYALGVKVVAADLVGESKLYGTIRPRQRRSSWNWRRSLGTDKTQSGWQSFQRARLLRLVLPHSDMNSSVTAIILAAGMGTRMKSTKAKVLHEAAGDTLLNHVLRAALNIVPSRQIAVVVGHQAEQVERSVSVEGVRFVEQGEQKGTGHALFCCRNLAGGQNGRLLILNGDGPLLKSTTLSGYWHCRIARARAAASSQRRLPTPPVMAAFCATSPAG